MKSLLPILEKCQYSDLLFFIHVSHIQIRLNADLRFPSSFRFYTHQSQKISGAKIKTLLDSLML